MRQAAMLAILLAAAVAGCADPGSPEDGTGTSTSTQTSSAPPSVDTGPPVILPEGQTPWRLNETLAAVDCATMVMSMFGADADWIRQQLPSGATLGGTAPQVNVILENCGSHAIGNRSVVRQASLFLAYVMVDRETSDGVETVAFPLEMSTSTAAVAAALQGWGIYSENVTVANANGSGGATKRVEGTTDDYEFTFGPAFPQRFQAPGVELRLWGDSDVALEFQQSREVDQFPLACVASFNAGRLAEAFVQPVPCTYTGALASETTLPRLIR